MPTDDQIAVARRLLASHAHTLAEGAGAAALAAVLNNDRFVGKQVAVICTGGNASPQELADLANPRLTDPWLANDPADPPRAVDPTEPGGTARGADCCSRGAFIHWPERLLSPAITAQTAATVRFGIFYEHQLPRPWEPGDEHRLLADALEQVELADRLGIDYLWLVEHHLR